MTNLQPSGADEGSERSEEKSETVRAATDNPTSVNDPTVETTAPVEDETSELIETAGTGDTEDEVAGETQTLQQTADLDGEPGKTKRRIGWPRRLAFVILPGLALLLAVAAGYLKWEVGLTRGSDTARDESVTVAKDSTAALLSYQPETVEKNLGAARERLTGTFKDSYTQLTNEVVIPGATQKHISAVAKVPAASSVSATPTHAVVLVFVDQTVVIGTDNPTDTDSSVRVTLDKVGGRWLISGFDPV